MTSLVATAALAATLTAISLVSSSVQAEVGNELHIGEAPAVITGLSPEGSNQVFTFQDGEANRFSVTCTIATLEGTTTAKTVTQVTLTPVYAGCQYGGSSVLIKMYGCKYRWDWTATMTADLNVVGCPTKEFMQIELNSECVIWFPIQGAGPHVTFQNVGSPNHLKAVTTVGGFTYQFLGAKCPEDDKVVKEDGELTGTTTVKAFQYDKEEKDVKDSFSGHKYTRYVDTSKQIELSSQ